MSNRGFTQLRNSGDSVEHDPDLSYGSGNQPGAIYHSCHSLAEGYSQEA